MLLSMEREFKILCVDDEPNILESFRRQLRGKFDLEVASSAAKALEHLKSGQRFSVIVSDMRMPGMDGIELLKSVQKISPLTVRVMLTGNADQDTAARAVNEGHIFRFVNKPCSPDELEKILEAATQQFKLLNAEKELLQNTLSGAIKVLTEILSLSDPVAFGIASAIREPVRKIAKILDLKNVWEIDLAAMLHAIGWIAVPQAIKSKFRNGEALTPDEHKMIERVPEFGNQFIGSIPRLEGVGRLILYSEKHFNGAGFPNDNTKNDQIPEGARIIYLAKALLKEQVDGITWSEALKKLRQRDSEFDTTLIDRVLGFEEQTSVPAQIVESFAIQPNQLCPGQRLTQDLFCLDGRLLISAGAYLSALMCKSILNYAQSGNLKLPIMVDAKTPKFITSEKR